MKRKVREAEPQPPVQQPEQPTMTALDVETLQDLAALPRSVPQGPLTAYEKSKAAYQKPYRAELARQREEQRQQMEQERLQRMEAEEELLRQSMSGRKPMKMTARDRRLYSRWLFSIGADSAARAVRRDEVTREQVEAVYGTRPREHTGRKVLLTVLLLLVVAAMTVHLTCFRQPVSQQALSERRKGVSTILLAGTDAGGYRTDSMMLLCVDTGEKTVSLVSIPRDTLIFCEYSVPKLNSAYGWGSGGEEGAGQLMRRVTEIIGFRPDGYLIADLETFASLVDLFGGVDFDVPVNMYYEDASQDLRIDIPIGQQHLSGSQAADLMRFRSGYADADLGRVSVQRSFLLSAVQQWTLAKNAAKVLPAVRLLERGTQTDLSLQNLLWLARSAVVCGSRNLQNRTMPGEIRYLAGGSYYVLDAQAAAETVNRCVNPYVQNVLPEALSIRQG